MTFLFPLGLLMLVPVAMLAVGYVVALQRKQRYAVRYAALPLLDKVIPERPQWRRHLPAGLLLLTLGLVGLAVARPEMPIRVPYERATIIVAIDSSESMHARDVSPDRLTAALVAAGDFIDRLPAAFNVGVVTFGGSTQVVHRPGTDHDAARASLRSVGTESRTAIGEGVFTSLDQIRSVVGVDEQELPAHIVLLSDGSNTSGRSPSLAAEAAAAAGVPVSTIAYGTESRTAIGEGVFTSLDQIRSVVGVDEQELPAHIVLLSDGSNTSGRSPSLAAQAAAAAGVPVSTIAYGTEDGVLDSGGYPVQVPVDAETLAELAAGTGGTAYTAASSDELQDVYRDIESSIGWRTELREVTPYVAAIALVCGLAAAALSIRWFSRLV